MHCDTPDCVNKVNLELGVEPATSRQELAIEKPGIQTEKMHRKEEEGTWRFCAGIWVGCGERVVPVGSMVRKGRSTAHSFSTPLLYQVFTPLSNSQVFIGNRTT